jgi:cytochrome P450
MTFLDEYRASEADPAGRSEAQAAVVRDWISSRPGEMLDDLREEEPTFLTGGMAFVTRFADVIEVLERNDIFSVEPYGTAMRRLNRGPNFLLGMDDGPEYRQELSLLQHAFHREDAGRIREIVSERTSERLTPALVDGRLDLTDGFGRTIPALFVRDYFGVPGPDPGTVVDWARAIFADAFVNVLQLPLLSRRAMKASAAFRAHLDGLIAGVKADRGRGAAAGGTVIGRLLALQESTEPALSDERIRDIVLWTVAGMIDNINTALSSTMDFLLEHADEMKGAAGAAAAGDTALVRQYVREALRFRTPTPVVTRLSTREHTLSTGTGHEKTIAAGTLVFAGMGAAMKDATVLDSPRTFRLDRPPHHYLHFGAGVHQCLGAHIAEAHLTEMVSRVLNLPGLRRAKGLAGRLRYAGPFPKKFVVEFEPAGVAA